MAFTPNVVDGDIILASWGNQIRDRTMQVFATAAERDAQWAAPPDGAHCVTLDSYTVWLRQTGVWRRFVPSFIAGSIFGRTVTAGQTADACTFAVPAGVGTRVGLVEWHATVTVSGDPVLQIQLRDPAAALVQTANRYPVVNSTSPGFQAQATIPAAGGTYKVTIGNGGAAGSSFTTYADNTNQQGYMTVMQL